MAIVRVSHQIQRFSCVAREDNLVGVSCPNEPGNSCTCLIVELRRLLAQGVDATMHISIGGAIDMVHGVEDLDWLLRRSCAVEKDQRLPMHSLLKDGEIASDALNIEG